MALFCTRLHNLASCKPLMWGCTTALVVQVTIEGLTILGLTDWLEPVCRVMHWLVGSIAPTILWMAWIELLARLDIRRFVLVYLTANVIQALISLVASMHIPLEASFAMVAISPVLSTFLLQHAHEVLGAAEKTDEPEPDAPTPWPEHEDPKTTRTSAEPSTSLEVSRNIPLAPICLMVTFTLANVFARDVLPAEDRSWATVGVLVCLVALGLVLCKSNMRFNLWPLCAVAFPLSLAGLFGLLLPSDTWGVPATLCTHAADTLFGVFIAVVLCNVSFRYGTSALYLFGLAKAAGAMAALAGAMLAFAGSPWPQDAFVVLVAGMSLTLTCCYVVLSWKQPGEITWGAKPKTSRRELGYEAGEQVSQELSLRDICSQAAYEYGLTRREEEVLSLLLRGMTAQQIEDRLCVSNSTVKSHTHAVYQKVGVHSRSELAEKIKL